MTNSEKASEVLWRYNTGRIGEDQLVEVLTAGFEVAYPPPIENYDAIIHQQDHAILRLRDALSAAIQDGGTS